MPRYARRRRRYKRSRGFGRSFHRHQAYEKGELKRAKGELAANLTTSWAAYNPTTDDSLFAVAEGVGHDDRIGSLVYIESMFIRGQICTSTLEAQASPMADTPVRIIIGIDSVTDGSEIATGSVLDNNGSNDLNSPRNIQYTDRIRVLLDKTMVVKAAGYSEGAVNTYCHPFVCMPFKFFHKFSPPLKVRYLSTGSTVVSIRGNSLFLMAICGSTTSGVGIDYQVRSRFRG